MDDRLVVTCEHGGCRIPARYRDCFRSAGEVLASHRGWDPGALPMAGALALRLDAPLFAATVSRLLVELNRSLEHPRLFSEFTRGLPRSERDRILELYWHPHRDRVERAIRRRISPSGPVLHLAVHSFTPVLDGEVRRADLGLLYDPGRRRELRLCRQWKKLIVERAPELRVRSNYPYRGTGDGFATYLRGRLPPDAYLGIEIEANQEQLRDPAARGRLARLLEDTLETLRRSDSLR